MKLTIVLLCLMSGCASTNSNGITTGSRLYDASIASNAGRTQAETSKCERDARVIFWDKAGNSAGGQINGVEAGQAFERCVKR